MYSWQFSKKFPLPKNGGYFEFSNFAKNGKTHICFYLINCARYIERFRRNFRPTGYLSNVLLAIFKKNFPSPKMAAILNFRIFAKNGKTQICLYLLNRVRQSDFVEIFDPQGISAMCSWQLKKIFPSPKMAAILNFRISPQNGKTQICFYFLNRAR